MRYKIVRGPKKYHILTRATITKRKLFKTETKEEWVPVNTTGMPFLKPEDGKRHEGYFSISDAYEQINEWTSISN